MLPHRSIVLVRLRATSDRYSTDLMAAELPVARGRRHTRPVKESEHNGTSYIVYSRITLGRPTTATRATQPGR